MERLSDRAIDILNDLHTERLAYESEYVPLIDAANTLAEYENTGLEPVAVERMQDAFGRGMTLRTESRERLEIISDIATNDLKLLATSFLSGSIVTPPCKLGDPVYIIVTKRHRVSGPYFSFIKKSHLSWSNMERVIRDFGNTVFLTREEANSKLSEMRMA